MKRAAVAVAALLALAASQPASAQPGTGKSLSTVVPSDREHVARERILIAQEDATVQAARGSARTDEERAFADAVIRERETNRRGGQP